MALSALELQETLKRTFGFDDFLTGQREVIRTVLAPTSAVAIFPTGAGKSLCYQLPALHLPGITLVVSPLLSLMKDQIDFLKSKNIPAEKLDSGMSRQDYAAALNSAREGRIKILMISVERFKNERFRLQLQRMRISLMVVDEAHCISEWGHNFRPDYLKIPKYQAEFNIPHVLLLTATATPQVTEDMCRKFGIPAGNVFSTGFYRRNLQLQVLPAPVSERDRLLKQTLAAAPQGASIVYVIQQKTAESVAGMLSEAGLRAEPYHAGMQNTRRDAIQNRFMANKTDVVVATIAFGMGIDKPDIRKVIHYDLPKSVESYSQEIGRAGRDGDLSVCTVLGNRGGVPILENFAYGDTPEKSGIHTVLQRIKSAADANRPRPQMEIRLMELSRDTDIRLLPLKTLLVYLEIRQIIQPRYVYFEDYPFKFIAPPDEIAARFQGERRQFVDTIFHHTATAKVWSQPDMVGIASASGAERQRIVAALDYFDQNGWIELQPKSSVEVFIVLNANFDIRQTADELYDLFQARETFEVERIARMLRLLEDASCLALALSAYFGEELAQACGICSACRGAESVRLPESDLPPLPEAEFDRLIDPLKKKLESAPKTTLLTRFLCGISSPILARVRARSLKGFGQLASHPYREVQQWVTTQMREL